MTTDNWLIRTVKWIYTKQKQVLFALAFLIIVVILKNSAINSIDSFEWYKKSAIYFIQLIEWIAILILALSLISKIPYLRVPLISIGMSAVFILAIEAGCLLLVEYKNRPQAEEKKIEIENIIPSNNTHQTEIAVTEEKQEPETQIMINNSDVDEIPPDFETLKKNGEPKFRKEDPAWHEWQQTDSIMGYSNKPNAIVKINSWCYGIPNPEAVYTIDSLGRRITGNDIHYSRKKYALFLGCSVGFGVLVDDKQTLPSIFERTDTLYRSYNYSVTGYGTHHILALFENRNLRNEISEPDGAAFYIYFPGHTNRAIGDMESYLSWNAESPFYFLKGDEVIRHGNFKTGRKLISWFYEFLPTTYIGRYFDIRLPGKLRSYHYRFTAKLIEKSYREYQKQFSNDNFYVVSLPGWGNEISPYLEELHIKHLDYSDLVAYWQDKYQFAGDGHPRPQLYKLMAEQIKKDITQ